MKKKKNKKNSEIRSALFLLPIISVSLLVNYLAANAILFVGCFIVFVVLIIAVKYYRKSRNKKIEESILENIRNICHQYGDELAIERYKSKRKKAYNLISHEAWYKKGNGVNHFYDQIVASHLMEYINYVNANIKFKEKIISLIDDLSAEYEYKKFSNTIETNEMSGVEFELYIATRLSSMGYECANTKSSGDQGVDILAKKNGMSISVQCKRYSKSVGNSAVQEIIAGMKYYGTNFGAVVSNQAFTSSAIELAAISNIFLVHEFELEKLNDLIN